MSNPLRLIVAGLAVLLLVAGIFIGVWPGRAVPQRFVAAKGATVRTIAADLKANRLIGSARAFLMWAKVGGSKGAPRPGVYQLKPGYTGYRIYQQLRRGPPMARVTFPEGWTA